MTARQRRDADTAIKYAQDVKKRLEARFSGDGETNPVTAPDEAGDRLRELKETQKAIGRIRKITKFQADNYDAATTEEAKERYANGLRQRQATLNEYQAEIEERSKGLDLSDSDRTGLKRAQNALKRAQEDIDHVLGRRKAPRGGSTATAQQSQSTSSGAPTPRGGSVDHQRENSAAQRSADSILHEVRIGRFEEDKNASFGRGRSAEAVRRDFVRGGRNRLDSAQDALNRIDPKNLTPAERDERRKTLADMEKARGVLDRVEAGDGSETLRREVMKDESGNLPFREAFQDVGQIIGQAQSVEDLDRGERALNDIAKRPDANPAVIDTARAILDQKRREMAPAPTQERVKGVDSTVSLAKTQVQKARRARTEKAARDHINTLNGTERDLNRNLERSGDRMPADQRAEVEQALQEIRAARVKAEQNIPLRDRTHLRPADLPALREEAESRRYTIANPRVNAAVNLFNEIPSGTDLPNGRRYEQSVDMDDVYAMDNPPSVPELNRAIDALEKEGDGDYDDEMWVLRTVRDNMKEKIDRERAETEAANTSLFGNDLNIPEPTPARQQSRASGPRPGDPKDGPFRRGADRLRRAGINEFTPNQARQVDEMKRDQWEAAQARVDAGESLSDVLGSTAARNQRDPMGPPSVSRDEVQRRLAERRAARGAAPRPAGQSEDRTNKTAVNIGTFGVRSEAEARQMYANTPRRDIADIPKGGNGHIGNGIWVKRCPVCGQAFKSVGAPGYSATYARHTGMMS